MFVVGECRSRQPQAHDDVWLFTGCVLPDVMPLLQLGGVPAVSYFSVSKLLSNRNIGILAVTKGIAHFFATICSLTRAAPLH